MDFVIGDAVASRCKLGDCSWTDRPCPRRRGARIAALPWVRATSVIGIVLRFAGTSTVLSTLALGCTRADRPVADVAPSSELVILPRIGREQFSSAVRTFRDQVERAHAVSATEYADIRMALRHLADAIQLLPRGSEVLATIDAANVIRDAAVRIASPVLDDPSRTTATKQALRTAADTLDRVARHSYRETPSVASKTAELRRTVEAIDESRVLERERAKVLLTFNDALEVLEDIERASAEPAARRELADSGATSPSPRGR
jgi:hypothetical protein